MCNQSQDVFVCISVFSSQEHRYLSLNSLITSLEGDPDLSSIQEIYCPKCYKLYSYVQVVIMCPILLVLESPPF